MHLFPGFIFFTGDVNKTKRLVCCWREILYFCRQESPLKAGLARGEGQHPNLIEELPSKQDLFQHVTHSAVSCGARRHHCHHPSSGEGVMGTDTQALGRAGSRVPGLAPMGNTAGSPRKPLPVALLLHPPDTSFPWADSDETRGNGFKLRGKV